MSQQTVNFPNTFAEIYGFENVESAKEYHMMIHVKNFMLPFEEQLQSLVDTFYEVSSGLAGRPQAVMKRYFLSDAANQAGLVREINSDERSAVSIIQQPPLDGSKVALWAYLVSDIEPTSTQSGTSIVFKRGKYTHLWTGGLSNEEKNSQSQTALIFKRYIKRLSEFDMTLERDCTRTWFFVSDIDNRYSGMVRARNDVFDSCGMTCDTHFIASTGIGGVQQDPSIFVQMDACATGGLDNGQKHYLYASDHLNRTSEYGVRFERGTYIDYGDRRHIFISGTASIDHKGNIMHSGNIVNQTNRLLENIEALLKEADASFDDLAQVIVYLRDPSDFQIVRKICSERLPAKPLVIVHAPVCRPGWLVEMECIGIKKTEYPEYDSF